MWSAGQLFGNFRRIIPHYTYITTLDYAKADWIVVVMAAGSTEFRYAQPGETCMQVFPTDSRFLAVQCRLAVASW